MITYYTKLAYTITLKLTVVNNVNKFSENTSSINRATNRQIIAMKQIYNLTSSFSFGNTTQNFQI